MSQKQDWTVTIKLTEKEAVGSNNIIKPWYDRRDVEDLIRSTLRRGEIMQDLSVVRVEANEDGQVYI